MKSREDIIAVISTCMGVECDRNCSDYYNCDKAKADKILKLIISNLSFKKVSTKMAKYPEDYAYIKGWNDAIEEIKRRLSK